MSVTSNLPLKLGLVDTKNQLTAPTPDRASDAYVVNPDNVMIHYRGNGENLITYSADLTDGSWVETGSGTVNSATLFTFAAQNDVLNTSVTTVEGRSYIYSFKVRAVSGNTSLTYVYSGSATGSDSPLTVTSTLTRYSITVLGRVGGGTVSFGIQDRNVAGHGQIEFTEIQVEETSVPINELETQAGYETNYSISLADGASWFGGDDLGSDLFDAGAGVFTSGTYNWTVYGGNGIANVGNTLAITHSDNAAGAHLEWSNAEDLTADLTVGQLYKVKFDASIDTGSAEVHIYNQAGSSIDSVTVDKTALQTFIIYFVATHATGDYMRMAGMGGGEVITLDNITIQAVTSPAEFADSGFLLQVTDGSGNKASGYIGEVGSGETLGIEKLSNPSFDVNTTGWAKGRGDEALDSVAGGVSNNALRITEGGTGDPYANGSIVITTNKQYKAGVWVKQGTESTYSVIMIMTPYLALNTGDLESTATWTHIELYGVASDTPKQLFLVQRAGGGSNTTLFFDEASWKEVTEPNPNSVMIYKTQALASEGWANIEDGFDPNDIATWEIYDNKLGDTEPRTYAATSGATASIPAEAPFDSKGLVNIGPVTNWLLQSNGFDEGVWSHAVVTLVQDEIDIAGDANTAWTIGDDNAGVFEGISQEIVKATSDTNIYTKMFFIKKDSDTSRFPAILLEFDGVSKRSYIIHFNTSTGNVVEATTTAANMSYNIFDYGDWWGISISASDNTSNNIIRVFIYPAASTIIGTPITSATGSIIICHAMLTKTPYALPFHIPTTTVPVTTTAQVVPWTMSTVFKGLLSDAVNGSESEGTLIASWTPYWNETDGSGNAGIISVNTSGYSLLWTLHGSTIGSFDGSSYSYSDTLDWTANTTYTVIVRWSKRQNKLQVSVIDAGVLTNGTATAYDDAFTLGTDFIIGYANNYPFSIQGIQVYNSWLSDFEVKSYPDSGSTVRRHIKQGR